MPTYAQITHHHDFNPDDNPWVNGPPPPTTVEIVAYNPDWPARYERMAARIREKLGSTVLHLEHVGSTSVPGLAAKDVIDIDMTVADSSDEATYIPALAEIGYQHSIREPKFYEHRALRHDEPRVNLHVWSPDSPEAIRHQMFRDWLIAHADDREHYERAKRAAIPGGGHVMDYNFRKETVVREIYDRLFRAAGMLSDVEP